MLAWRENKRDSSSENVISKLCRCQPLLTQLPAFPRDSLKAPTEEFESEQHREITPREWLLSSQVFTTALKLANVSTPKACSCGS